MKKLSDILKGKTCAVVSNSGSLLENEYGINIHDKIDEHIDKLIRKGYIKSHNKEG